MNRFTGGGLYILDEPEAALSPSRQMAMVSRIHNLVKENSQFIIATHSPIIMSYPNSKIYEIKDTIREAKYDETENYMIMRSFINNTKSMIDMLINEN